jgi:hypothetical protein
MAPGASYICQQHSSPQCHYVLLFLQILSLPTRQYDQYGEKTPINRLKTKRNLFYIYGISAYRAVNPLHLGLKPNQLMTYKIKFAVCSDICKNT